MKKSNIITAAAIAAATVGTIAIVQQADAASVTIMRTTANVNLRTGPGTNYKSLGIVLKDLEVGVVSFTSNGWAKLENGNYVCAAYLVKATNYDKNNIMYLYTTANLNLRKGPGTGYSKIITIPKGAKVKYITKTNGWAKVTYNGYTGWCSKQYLSVNKSQTKTYINKIIINRDKHKAYCYSNGTLIKTLDCAVGKSSTPTPKGTCKIVKKIVNPYYSKGNIAGGSSRNPLGTRWMGISIAGTNGSVYGIHGNNNESSIGKSISNGCIRLHDIDAEWLFDLVTENKTIVTII